MHAHLYQLDQVNAGIQQYHRDALQHEQLRLARGTQPDRIALLTMRLRGAVTTLGMRLHHRRPAVVQDLVAVPTLTDAPAESAVVI